MTPHQEIEASTSVKPEDPADPFELDAFLPKSIPKSSDGPKTIIEKATATDQATQQLDNKSPLMTPTNNNKDESGTLSYGRVKVLYQDLERTPLCDQISPTSLPTRRKQI